MSLAERGWIFAAALATFVAGSQLSPASALADPEDPPPADPAAQGSEDVLHNIVYRARVDGVSRGATITFAAEGNQTQTANPTMVPGRTFEANTVLPESATANMRVSIDWPYSANLTCEILVDDAVVAKAEDFIAPRVLPVKDDPDYGALTCEAPVSGIPNPAAPGGGLPPADPPPVEGAPVDGAAPASA
ncbi:hypothetical protein CQY20_22900 [Mycolicibacterium agri]|uniref:Uncharacterized protein n=1 Tax=Mycolicibacterium agri TaxID=36811 RepID=A0A2A7MUB7_MYCAG|nr:hypothetical protein [Mycolicibacterium agri]PEG35139.1 hypothetical protein CQY20_22900 [Mycolicibacterium agri]GFG49038.1 hypothetical protein MAGR_04790 [Mycolicibacterium agri]